ncbi:MAG: hypothetical protein ACI8WB_003904 [Phenylobacterium sp.]|jgi:hypothetical protein
MAFNEVELAQVRRSGEHFKKILRETFEQLPRSARSIAGLARLTGVNKSTCQRLVQALTKSHDGVDVIVTLPGQTGLRQLSDVFAGLITDQESVQNFAQFVEQYEDLILQYASSQSELKRLLLKFQNKSTESFEAYQKKLKKSAFETNKEISGESVECYLGIHIYRVNPQDDSFIDELIVSNRSGIHLTKSARPFVQSYAGNLSKISIGDPVKLDSSNVAEQNLTVSSEYLLSEFSTPDIERCYAGVGNMKNTLIYNHTLAPIECNQFDITLARMDVKAQPNPLTDAHKIICQGQLGRSPAKRLIMMSFMAKSLDKGCTIQSGCYPTSLAVHETDHQPEDLWSERFSDSPEIKVFTPADQSLNNILKLSHVDELVRQSFAFIQQDPQDFVGYFSDIEYPLWLTSHRLYFEFS